MTDDDIDRRLAQDAAAWNNGLDLPTGSLTAAVQHAVEGPTPGRDPRPVRRQRRSRRDRRWSAVRGGNVGLAIGVLALIAALLIPFALTRPDRGADNSRGTAATGPRQSSGVAAGIPTLPLVCPGDDDGSVTPAKPTIPDGSERLVPARAPLSAVVCAYRSTSGSKLGIAVPIFENLADVAQLSLLPRLLPGQQIPCSGVGFSGPYASLLLGIRYADGVLWVNGSANTTDCTEATNGAFESSANASATIIALARANGQIIPTPDVPLPGGAKDPCQPAGSIGRLGQEITMVPGGAKRVTVCRVLSSSGGSSYRHVSSTAVGPLAGVLNAEPTTPSNRSTRCTGGSPTAFYEARFDYSAGPAVLVRVKVGCTPSVDNSSLQATNGAGAADAAEQLLGGH